ncbi:response regulator [Pedobacter nyackensis]|uniref:PAS domain S-box-containing protein n=1 Tax=Pedobacter nyackensis TaxID=475255 RepID=A0A1W2A1H8_9SPHI|nr:PAS domain S-box protein [Pedobacter nyackensis]SMC54547.1 PAS domain S-box-containing protein [Pedobacter nyackensis]
MFNQNVLIVKEDHHDIFDDSLNIQLLNIGYRKDQLFTRLASACKKKPDPGYEVILFVTENMEDASTTILKINTCFPEIPIIIVTSTISEQQILPAGADDWLLKSWTDPILLKKTILLSINRKKNTHNYLNIFRENPSPMYIYEKDTYRFMEVNMAALKQYGYARTEFIQLTAEDIRPETELGAFYKINSELPPEYSNAGIWQHKRKNGELFYVHVFTHQIMFGNRNCKLVMAIDIDSSVKSEQAVKEKAREIENILESITDGFFTVNKQWEFTYINKEFERILKHTREELLGKNLWDAFPEVIDLDFYTQYHKAMNENISVHFEEYNPVISRWLSVNAYPTDTGLAIYFIDNTDQKSYQQKIESQNRQFKEIAWVQAHQIRGPVSNLLGLVELFNIKQPNDPGNLELLARVKHTAIQMDESIQEIVYLTRKLES